MSPGRVKFALLECTILGKNEDQGSRQCFPQTRSVARILWSPSSILKCVY